MPVNLKEKNTPFFMSRQSCGHCLFLFPLFRKNVSLYAKLCLVLCNFDIFFSEKCSCCYCCFNSNFKMVSIWEKEECWPIFHIFFLSPGKRHAHKNLPSEIFHVWFLFGLLVWLLVLIRIPAILERSINKKEWAN